MSSHLNTYSIFRLSFAICLIIALHLTLDYSEGLGLYLPNNAIIWIFIFFWIGLGTWKIHLDKVFYFSRFSKFLTLGIFFLFLPFIFQRDIPYDLIYIRFAGVIGILILYICLQQFNFNKKDYTYFYFVIICSVLLKSSAELIFNFFPDFLLNTKINIYLFNTLNHRNVQSTYLIFGTLLPLYYFLKSKKDLSKYSFKELILYLTTFNVSIILMLLQSRTAILALPISIILIFIGKYNFHKKIVVWALLTFFGLIIGNYLKKDFSKNTKDFSKNTRFTERSNSNFNNSIDLRIMFYEFSFDLWLEKPFTGHGYGTFLSTFRNYYAEQKSKDPDLIYLGPQNVLHPHNELCFWLVEGGIIPFTGLLIIAGAFITLMWKTKSRKPLALLGCIFPILFHTQLEYPFYNSAIHLFLFCFFICQIDQKYGTHYKFKNSFKILPKLLAIIIPLFSILYLGTVLQTGYMITKFEKSDNKNIQLLQKAINPNVLKVKYDNYLLKEYLRKAKKSKNKQKLKHYISIVEENIEHSPFMFLYYDLATAYKALGNMDKAEKIYNRAQYLYPSTN